jgi:excisionase family DNA binding protein
VKNGAETSERSQIKTKREAAAALRCSPRKVNNLMKTGALPFVRIGGSIRFLDSDIQRLIEAGRVVGTEAA